MTFKLRPGRYTCPYCGHKSCYLINKYKCYKRPHDRSRESVD